MVGSDEVLVPLAVRVNGTPIKSQPAQSAAVQVTCSAGNFVAVAGRLTPG